MLILDEEVGPKDTPLGTKDEEQPLSVDNGGLKDVAVVTAAVMRSGICLLLF